MIREKLHHYIDLATEPQLQAIYLLLEEKIESVEDRISVEQYNNELKEAEDRIDAGDYYTQEEIKKLIS